MFAVSIVFSGIAILVGLVLLALSKFWTLTEKLIAVAIPIILFAAVGFWFNHGGPTQDWLRIPMMFSFSGIGPAFAALYLYLRSREGSKVAIY